MEGYVQIYHKKRYAKFWCILDGQQLSYYERLDLHDQLAIGFKGTIYLKNADILSMVHETRPHVIRIKPEGRKGYEYIDCERAADQTTWLQCLMRATAIHDAHISRSKEVMRFASLLGIDPSVKLSQRVVARAYRKMCLKAHPDRGGDVHHFNEISAAYTQLMAIQADVEARERSDEIEYEAIVEKGPEGIGLGLLVQDDPVRQRTVVLKMNDNIILHGLSAEANGEILPADSLVGIDKDDCMLWPFTRIRARLNAFRIPVGGTVRLRFQRRQTVASMDEDLDLNASGNISLSPGPEEAAAADDVAPATEEPQRAEPFDLNGDDEVSDLNVTFAISLEDNEHMEKAIKIEPEREVIDLQEYRRLFMELENTKNILRESERNAESWKTRAGAVLSQFETMKTKHDAAVAALQEQRSLVERNTVEITYLNTKIQNLEASTPATASDVLLLSRASSGLSLEQVFDIKRDKKLIAANLAQLRYYCGDNAGSEEGADQTGAVDDPAEWEDRTAAYLRVEDEAERLEADIMQLIEWGAAVRSGVTPEISRNWID